MNAFERTSLMHHKPHAPEHMVRVFDTGDVHVVCADCGLHDWGDWGNDESQYTVENFKAKYGDRVMEVVDWRDFLDEEDKLALEEDMTLGKGDHVSKLKASWDASGKRVQADPPALQENESYVEFEVLESPNDQGNPDGFTAKLKKVR